MLGRKSLEDNGVRESDNTHICFIYDYPSLQNLPTNETNRMRAEIYGSIGENFGIPGEFIFLQKLGDTNMEEQFDDRAVNFA